MRFATVAVMAGVAAANTVYQTDYVTITSCGPEVPDCPASSTVVYSSTYAVSTTAPVEEYPVMTPSVSKPAQEYPTVSKPAEEYPVMTPSVSKPAQEYPVATPSSSKPAQEYPTVSKPAEEYPTVSKPAEEYPVHSASTKPVSPPVYPTGGVSTSVVTYSTCVPTVSYSTVTIYPTGSASHPAGGPTGYPTGGVSHPAGGPTGHPTGGYPTVSAPVGYPTVPVAGAPKMAGSVLLAAAAGVAAVLLA